MGHFKISHSEKVNKIPAALAPVALMRQCQGQPLQDSLVLSFTVTSWWGGVGL